MTPQEQEYQKRVCGEPGCKIPYGYCHCGCGGKTPIARKTQSCWKTVQGLPYRFLNGHRGRIRTHLDDAGEFKIDGVYCRLIPLDKGQYAIVDAADYAWLSRWAWHARRMRDKRCYYAARTGTGASGKSVTIFMHREILGLPYISDGRIGDHINYHTADNRRTNLRVATKFQSSQHRRTQSSNTSGFKGVSFNKQWKKWSARIRFEGRQIHLGYFSSPEAAAEVYKQAALRLHSEFACI